MDMTENSRLLHCFTKHNKKLQCVTSSSAYNYIKLQHALQDKFQYRITVNLSQNQSSI